MSQTHSHRKHPTEQALEKERNHDMELTFPPAPSFPHSSSAAKRNPFSYITPQEPEFPEATFNHQQQASNRSPASGFSEVSEFGPGTPEIGGREIYP